MTEDPIIIRVPEALANHLDRGGRRDPANWRYPAWVRKQFAQLLDEIHAACLQDRDVVIIITGKERSGKSTLARHIGRMLDETFDHTRATFSAPELIKKSVELSPGQVLVLDEAVEGAFSQETLKEVNRALVKHLVVSGALNVITIICFPNIRWLAKYIAEHRADIWLHVERRGVFLAHKIRRAKYRGAKSSWRQLWLHPFPPPPGDADDAAYLHDKNHRIRDDAARSDQDASYIPMQGEVTGMADALDLVLQEDEEPQD